MMFVFLVEALMHMLKALDGEAKEFELILFPRDNHLIMELKSEIQVCLMWLGSASNLYINSLFRVI